MQTASQITGAQWNQRAPRLESVSQIWVRVSLLWILGLKTAHDKREKSMCCHLWAWSRRGCFGWTWPRFEHHPYDVIHRLLLPTTQNQASPPNVTQNENYVLSIDLCETRKDYKKHVSEFVLQKKIFIVTIHLFLNYVVVFKKQRSNHVSSMVAVVEFCCGLKTWLELI